MQNSKSFIGAGAVVVVLFCFTAAVQAQFHYSTDIGSDLDISDPTSPPGFSDAGDIYVEPAGPLGGLIKNDEPGGPNTGVPVAGTMPAPFGGPAGQPAPGPPMAGMITPFQGSRANYSEWWT